MTLLQRIFGKKQPEQIQTSASAFNIFQQSMDTIHEKNQVVVDIHQDIIDQAKAVQDSAAEEVTKAENFKANLAAMFETPPQVMPLLEDNNEKVIN